MATRRVTTFHMRFFAKIVYFPAAPLLILTSCATITRGVHEKLMVTSDPPGANVTLSTGEEGVTPAKFVKLRRTETFTVTVSKPGYKSEKVKVESRLGGTGGTAMAGNVLIGGAIGLGVDAGTGAYNSLYPNPVSVRLVPRGKSAAAVEGRGGPSSTTKRSSPALEVKPRSSPSPRTSSSAQPTFPTAKPVPGKPGYVFSPFDTKGRYVDVSGYPSGSKAKDPWTDKIFIVP
jgi:hypothetical protein